MPPITRFAPALLLVACAPTQLHDHPHRGDFVGPDWDELQQMTMPVTCDPHMEFYPVAGPHDGGWHSNNVQLTCPPHAGHDNSDFLDGDHYGNDLFAAEGTPARAVVSGVITASGWGSSTSGYRVTLRDDCGWHYWYGHFEWIEPGITVGTYVEAGQIIGAVGDTGNAAGTHPHIHFGLYANSYYEGIDPFPYLQQADAGACTGESALQPGDAPQPTVNPCTNADIQSDDRDSSFAVVQGAVQGGTEVGGPNGGTYFAQAPYAVGVPYTVGKWQPWISHDGQWEVDVRVPQSPGTLTSRAVYDIAFLGGHALKEVDQQANRGAWVPLFPGQPFKFVAGPRGYVGLSNIGSVGTSGDVAWDAVRFRYIGPTGNGQVGAACAMSTDCGGDLLCGESGTCEEDCNDVGCDLGQCDATTGVCVTEDGAVDPASETGWTADTDGDGVPNYLEGGEDLDGDGAASWFDRDADGDGIDDAVEGAFDSDGDGLLDSQDGDSDGDGLSDAEEVGNYPDVPLDSDLDGTPDFRDNDSDGDGIPDATENGFGNGDADGDGIPNHLDSDSDNDGLSDEEEAAPADEEGGEPSQPYDSDGDGTPDFLQGKGTLIDLDEDATPLSDTGCNCSNGGAGAPISGFALFLLALAGRRRR